MQREDAASLIKKTFEKPFDKPNFERLTRELLNRYEPKSFSYAGAYIKEAFRGSIKAYERIGKYEDPEGNTIDILIVYLCRDFSVTHARAMQRNFIAWYLNGGRGDVLRDAALVAVVAPNTEDWRFSLVRMDYRREITASGRMKGVQEFTPARRYSFLVGQNERSHTAQQSLVPLLIREDGDPTLAELEDAFNIEKVTKEFFEKYRDLFHRVKENLDNVIENDSRLKEEFELKGVQTADFAKKLLGQIVFLYFLQKKGWFGVPRDSAWGAGPKDFIRRLFEKRVVPYENYFNDILEPLFYEALAIDRPGDFYSRFNGKIPFLNGGLFDPINDYDWIHTDIILPNELFSNANRTEQGDIGDGILDVFDRYNFTVCEDEPLEKEVAVDPEMLGKVFENLLEVIDRKSKGTYYTPREIVHYMCRESLIRYLSAEVPEVGRSDIEILIRHGEEALENDALIEDKGRQTSTLRYRMPPAIRTQAAALDRALENIRVCDPAAGSGAFLVGMMTEIVRARRVLGTYLAVDASPYVLKRHIIHNCLYGVDIDPGAVEIAKLRLWLSLVVDEEDIGRIKPLPNLDYKIMQGDSLIEEFSGVRLFDESLISSPTDTASVRTKELEERRSQIQKDYFEIKLSSKPDKIRLSLMEKELKIIADALKRLKNPAKESSGPAVWEEEPTIWKKVDELKALHRTFFDETRKKQKDAIKHQIEDAEWGLIEATLHEQGEDSTLKALRRLRKKPYFLWKLNFWEVYEEKSGFDIVIANPPYVRQESIKDLKPALKRAFGTFACGTADLYTYFYKKGLDILKPGGHLCFITPNKFMRAGYGKNTRHLLCTMASPELIIDFQDLPIFDATTYPSIILAKKQPPESDAATQAATFTDDQQVANMEATLEKAGFALPVVKLDENGWILEQPAVLALMEKLREKGVPLGEYVHGKLYYGIKTGLNEAFVIDAATRGRLISEDPKSVDIIKPWLRGRDIKKWKAEWARLYVITIPSSVNKKWQWSNAKTENEAVEVFLKTYPALYNHFKPFISQLRNRDDKGRFWWELRSCTYYEDFEYPKIVYPDISQSPNFSWDTSKSYFGNTVYFIPTVEQWLVGLLNAKLIWWYYTNLCSMIRGSYYRLFTQFMEQLPITSAAETQKAAIAERVQKIIAKPDSSSVPQLETEINRLVYVLYELTPEEIALVEGNTARNGESVSP